MKEFFARPGFLGTNAPLLSDISLVVMLLTAVLFTIGRQLARKKQFKFHRHVQTIAVIINAMVVLAVMINSFITHILPGIPGKLLEGDYGISTIHAMVGTAALLLGVFIVLRTNKLVPKALRFKNYKPFMQTSYWLYMLATLLGGSIYVLAFILGI